MTLNRLTNTIKLCGTSRLLERFIVPPQVRRLLDNAKMNGNGEAAAAAGSNGDGPATRSKTSRQRTQSESRRKDLKEERKGIVLWKRPFTTLYYGTAELLINVRDWCSQ